MRKISPELALSRLLQAFEAELIEAGDDEIAAALKDLGMRADMKGSAAFADLHSAAIGRGLAWLYRQPASDQDDEHSSSPADLHYKDPSAATDRKP